MRCAVVWEERPTFYEIAQQVVVTRVVKDAVPPGTGLFALSQTQSEIFVQTHGFETVGEFVVASLASSTLDNSGAQVDGNGGG
ncbi:MAG: hypothetical protein AAF108_01205 [Planctomycetota bacterium]